MQEISVNYWALLVAVIARMALGAFWYSPILFAGPWMRLVGRTPEELKAGMTIALATDLIGTAIMAFVLARAILYAGAQTVGAGAAVGFLSWLGFIAVTSFTFTVYEQRPFRLFLINNGFQLISLLIMGAILAVWR